MNGRDRVLAALSPEGTPEIPVVIPYEGILIRDHWGELSRDPWWVREDPDVEVQVAWRRQVAEALGQDWFTLPAARPTALRRRLRLERVPDRVALVDAVTGETTRLDAPQVAGWTAVGGVESVHPTHPPSTVEEVEAAIQPPAPWDAARYRTEGRADLADRLLATCGADLFPIRHVPAPLWLCYGRWGYEGLMAAVATAPDLLHAACRRYLDLALRSVQEAAALGAAGVFIEDCMTDGVGPAAFRASNVTYLRELTAAIRAAGLASIHYFCGNPAGKWEALLDTGADALSLEESKKGFRIDIAEVAERVDGRVALLGNLDAIHFLPQASSADLEAEIARQVAAGHRNGSRFVMSLGSPVTPGTTLECVREYCRLAHRLGAAR